LEKASEIGKNVACITGGVSVISFTSVGGVNGGVVYAAYKNRASVINFMGKSKQVVGEQLGKTPEVCKNVAKKTGSGLVSLYRASLNKLKL